MYVRIPHYVASFYRNRDEFHPVPVGGMVSLESETTLWDMLVHFLVPNPNEQLVREGCFCERMWRKMQKGYSLVEGAGGKFPRVLAKRDASEPLTDAEVRMCCQWSSPRYEDLNEYLCVELPSYVYRHHRQVKVDGQWQMMSNGYRIFVAEMRRNFWHCCVNYAEDFIEVSKKRGYQRSKVEGLERFMARYDIRNDSKNKTKFTLKRNYYRVIRNRIFQQEDFEEFGET